MGAAAFVGLVGAHILDYQLLFADPIRRRGILSQTGHSYFGKAIELAIAAAILASVGSFAFGLLRDGAASRHSTLRVATILALIQSGGFVAVEAAERVVARAPTGQMTRVVFLGIALQAAVATVTAFVLRLLERVGHVVARALTRRSPTEHAVAIAWWPREAARPSITLLSRASPRAPPLAPVL